MVNDSAIKVNKTSTAAKAMNIALAESFTHWRPSWLPVIVFFQMADEYIDQQDHPAHRVHTSRVRLFVGKLCGEIIQHWERGCSTMTPKTGK